MFRVKILFTVKTIILRARQKPESGQVGLFRETVEIPCTLPPVHPLLEWNYVARPLCDTVNKIGESEVDVVRVRAKSTNWGSRLFCC